MILLYIAIYLYIFYIYGLNEERRTFYQDIYQLLRVLSSYSLLKSMFKLRNIYIFNVYGLNKENDTQPECL
jgi:hypothetical protein